MKKTLFISFWLVCILLASSIPAMARFGSEVEALLVARRWTEYIMKQDGSWGGSKYAQISSIKELKLADRRIGYFCRVEPKGFIIVSILRELAPVKAYSTTCDMNPADEEGAALVIKKNMLSILTSLEKQAGDLQRTQPGILENIVRDRYASVWKTLEDNSTLAEAPAISSTGNYKEGESLILSAWHQRYPYNNDCPSMACPNIFNNKAPVGCTALAAAQIMYYWSWPPCGQGSPYEDLSYYWNYMFDSCNDQATIDDKGASIDAARISAVARLCYEIGDAINMDYNCDGSGAYMQTMSNAYTDHFRYPQEVHKMDRGGDSAAEWFQYIKDDVNKNQPVQLAYFYKDAQNETEGHSIIIDGWREDGSTPLRYYHANFGWQNSSWNYWYQVDELPNSDDKSEQMIINIVPNGSLGGTLMLPYFLPDFPFRYFSRDAVSLGASFVAGHNLQFLPGVKVTQYPGQANLTFIGETGKTTMLFSHHGTYNKGAFCKIYNGKIKIYGGGGLKVAR